MPFLDSLDIANRAIQYVGGNPILSVDEDSLNNQELSAAYDKVRRAELRRNVWRFSVRRAALRAIDTTTLTMVPGLYDASKTYLIGEVVRDANGLIWISQAADNINNPPGGNNSAWDMYFGPMTASLYTSSQSYYAGELVYMLDATAPSGYRLYMSLASSNADTPSSTTAFDPAVQYKQDDVVSYGGYQWRSLLPVNVGTTPTVGPSSWNSGTTYSSGAVVTGSDNYVYSSLQSGNVGNDPTVSPTYWSNTGTLTAWSRTPALPASSINWRPITAALSNLLTIYPLDAGPISQSGTKNVFRLPAGFLREAPQDPKTGIGFLGAPTAMAANDWLYEGDYIVSRQGDPIILRFVADVSKVTQMDDMFCEGLAARLATAVCERLTQSTAKLQSLAGVYKQFMGDAREVNGIESGPIDPALDEFLACRF